MDHEAKAFCASEIIGPSGKAPMGLLRTFLITETLPYPALAGMDLRNLQNINGLLRFSAVGVFGLNSNDPRSRKMPPASVALWRASTDCALTYPLPEKKLPARAWLLNPAGHPSDLYYSDAAATEVIDLVESFRPHLIIVEGLWLHRYIPILKRHCRRIVLDLHAVEAVMSREIASSTSGNDLKARLLRDVLPARVKLVEHQAANDVDQIWVCSREDARLMQEVHDPSAPIHIIPNTVNVDDYKSARTGRYRCPESVVPKRRTVIFPAIFRWQPNADAADFLIDQVFPRLARMFPDCQLLLIGADPTTSMKAAAERDSRIVVTGLVPDVVPFLALGTVMAVPLFQGGGTRLKILEGFAAKVAVVTTQKGVEGIGVENGRQILLAESVEEFVGAIKRIWTEEGLAEHLATNGLELVTHAYSWEASSRRIRQAVTALELGE
jgi:polysaccharide biosynthesis protein PslH